MHKVHATKCMPYSGAYVRCVLFLFSEMITFVHGVCFQIRLRVQWRRSSFPRMSCRTASSASAPSRSCSFTRQTAVPPRSNSSAKCLPLTRTHTTTHSPKVSCIWFMTDSRVFCTRYVSEVLLKVNTWNSSSVHFD